MELIWDAIGEMALALLGIVCSLGAFFLGRFVIRVKKKLLSDTLMRSAAENAVLAAEQILGAGKGEEKFSLAMDFALGLLSEQGVTCSQEQMEVLIEATLASFRGVFQEEKP